MSTDVSYRYDPTRFREVFEHRFSYIGGVQRNSRRYGSRPALHDPATDRRWTYSELWRDSGRLAAGLSAAGVGSDDVVVFDLLNGPEFALLWLAVQRLGAIAAPINFRLASGEVAHVLDDSRPRAFVYDLSVAGLAADAVQRAGHTPELIAVVDAEGGRRTGAGAAALPFTELIATDDHELPDLSVRTIWEESTRLYTSGTTGLPRGSR